jgi:FMN-dependent NADH-azoreductase
VPTLLAITVSPRFEYSVSRKLTDKFIEDWKAAHPDGKVIVRDLMKTELPWVDLPWIGGSFTPAEQHSEEMKKAIRVSDDLIAELKAADDIVIGTPMYNFLIPAILKAYIDHVVRVGITFTMNYEGLLTGKKATVIIASGSDFGPGTKYESANVASSYMRQILGFIGITDVNVVLAGGTLAIDMGQKTFEDFVAPIESGLTVAARA